MCASIQIFWIILQTNFLVAGFSAKSKMKSYLWWNPWILWISCDEIHDVKSNWIPSFVGEIARCFRICGNTWGARRTSVTLVPGWGNLSYRLSSSSCCQRQYFHRQNLTEFFAFFKLVQHRVWRGRWRERGRGVPEINFESLYFLIEMILSLAIGVQNIEFVSCIIPKKCIFVDKDQNVCTAMLSRDGGDNKDLL